MADRQSVPTQIDLTERQVLAVDDDPDQLAMVRIALKQLGVEVRAASSRDEALAELRSAPPDLVLTDYQLGQGTGLDILEALHADHPRVPAILMTGHGSTQVAIDAIRLGVADFLEKPLSPDLLTFRVQRALEVSALGEKVERLQTGAGDEEPRLGIIGRSPAITEVVDLVHRVADSDVSVLVTGESGTGKEVVAQGLHRASPRASEPFMAVNCAALPAELIESELFGHEAGAFTGATRKKDGLFIAAQGGTLFLDEIGELPLEMQGKLLRVLESREVRPVGSSQVREVKARIVAATNRNLEDEIASGDFREDLFYRLCVVELSLPPLRTRGNDILELAQFFLRKHQGSSAKVTGIAAETARCLLNYDWPGNVRELENAIRRGLALARYSEIAPGDLPASIENAEARPRVETEEASTDEGQLLTLEEVEARYIRRVLQAVNGNKSKAARVLGLNRRTLYRRLEQMSGEQTSEDSQDAGSDRSES